MNNIKNLLVLSLLLSIPMMQYSAEKRSIEQQNSNASIDALQEYKNAVYDALKLQINVDVVKKLQQDKQNAIQKILQKSTGVKAAQYQSMSDKMLIDDTQKMKDYHDMLQAKQDVIQILAQNMSDADRQIIDSEVVKQFQQKVSSDTNAALASYMALKSKK